VSRILLLVTLPLAIGLAITAHAIGWTEAIILIALIVIAALLGRAVDILEHRR
jgi:hypothetical protein